MKQEFRKTSELSLWEDNPRNIRPKDFERLKKQIQELGQYKPLLITEDGTVIGGNMRLRAYMDLGIEDIWVSVVNPKDDNQMLAYALSDNDRAGYYDDDLLANLSSAYPDFEWGNYAVDLQPPTTLDDLFKTDVVEDEVPELDEGEPVSKLGEIYQLGKHRLMCGDSTKIEDVEKLMNGQKADMVFTDPPYGVNYTSRVDEERRKGWGGIKNDQLQGAVLNTFLHDALAYFSCAKYVCCNWQSVIDFWGAYGKPNSLIVWDKGSIGLGAGYRNQHEFILFYGTLDHNSESNVWSITRDSTGGYEHPTQKPIAIPSRAIKNSSRPNQLVVDVFGGSGSTLIACEQLDRTCYMMELDPKYCDVIRKRYAKFIGKEETWEEVSPRVMQADQQSTQTS